MASQVLLIKMKGLCSGKALVENKHFENGED